MGKKKKKGDDSPGMGFIEAIESAQKAERAKFMDKFATQVEITVDKKKGEIRISKAKEKTDGK